MWKETGAAQIKEAHTLAGSMLTYGSGASLIRAVQEQAEQGSYGAEIFIEEEFKGRYI